MFASGTLKIGAKTAYFLPFFPLQLLYSPRRGEPVEIHEVRNPRRVPTAAMTGASLTAHAPALTTAYSPLKIYLNDSDITNPVHTAVNRFRGGIGGLRFSYGVHLCRSNIRTPFQE